MRKSYTVKIYGLDSVYIKTINPTLVTSEVTFFSQINGGQGQCMLDLALPFDDFDEGNSIKAMNLVKIYESDDVNSPTPRLIFTGFISQYTPYFDGARSGVKLTLLGLVTLLSYGYYKTGGGYTVSHSAVDPAAIMKAVIADFDADYPDLIDALSGTVDDVGENVTYSFVDQKRLDALKKAFELAGPGRYWHIGADGKLYFKAKPTTATHRFTLGYDAARAEILKNSEQIINKFQLRWNTAYGSTSNFSDAASIAKYGVHEKVQNDERITTSGTAEQRGNQQIMDFKDVKVQARLHINANYDIETIKPGDTCSVFNFKVQELEPLDFDSLSSITNWYITDDAVNLVAGADYLQFDIDVSNDADNFVQIGNSTLAVLDLGNYTDGYIEVEMYIPDVSLITGITINIGDGTNGLYGFTTLNYVGGALVNGENKMWFKISEMPQYSSDYPDLTAINYCLVKMEYSAGQGDMAGVKLLGFRAINPYKFLPRNMLITGVRYSPDGVDLDLENNKATFAEAFADAVQSVN